MGYGSELVFGTSEKGYERFKALLAEEMSRLPEGIRITGFDIDEKKGPGRVFGLSGVRWYPEFEDVQAFERAWERLDNEGFPWTRVRVGEDTADFEELDGNDGYGADIPHVVARLVWDWY